jgi:type VI secretion system secreted protein VgrG
VWWSRPKPTAALARYRLEAQPWLALLAHTRRSPVWQEESLTTIVDSIFGSRNGTLPNMAWRWADDVADHLARSPFTNAEDTRSYTVQYRETDLAFVHRLLAEEGLIYRVNPDSSVVILADTTCAASCPLKPQSAANGLINFRAAKSSPRDAAAA